MRYLFGTTFLVVLCVGGLSAQPLPAGKWRLHEYKFADKVEQPLKGANTTLNVKADGKLGGDTGCNAYGGSYAIKDGKLKIADLISTMRACDEPTPQFEKAYFQVLENAVSAEVKNGLLVIADNGGHYLKFDAADTPSK